MALEGDIAGQGEGRRHWYVTDIGGGPDPRYVLRCEQARARGKHVVNIAMAAMCRHHCEVGDDRVVTVVRGDHEPDWFSVRQRRDPPPLVRAGVALEFVAVLLLCGLAGGHAGQVVAAVRVQSAVQHERHEFDELAKSPPTSSLRTYGKLLNRSSSSGPVIGRRVRSC